MLAKDQVLVQSRSEDPCRRHWFPHCTGSERHTLVGIVLGNIRPITGSSKVLLQCLNRPNQVAMCVAQMNSSCADLVHNRDMHRCATVFEGKWRGQKRTHIRR